MFYGRQSETQTILRIWGSVQRLYKSLRVGIYIFCSYSLALDNLSTEVSPGAAQFTSPWLDQEMLCVAVEGPAAGMFASTYEVGISQDLAVLEQAVSRTALWAHGTGPVL